MTLTLRPLRAEDYRDAARIFFCAVHDGTRHAYTLQERRAWAGDSIDLPRWQTRLASLTGFVAVENAEPVGFMAMIPGGHLDLAFVLPSCAGRGIGRALLDAVEAQARALGRPEEGAHARHRILAYARLLPAEAAQAVDGHLARVVQAAHVAGLVPHRLQSQLLRVRDAHVARHQPCRVARRRLLYARHDWRPHWTRLHR